MLCRGVQQTGFAGEVISAIISSSKMTDNAAAVIVLLDLVAAILNQAFSYLKCLTGFLCRVIFFVQRIRRIEECQVGDNMPLKRGPIPKWRPLFLLKQKLTFFCAKGISLVNSKREMTSSLFSI